MVDAASASGVTGGLPQRPSRGPSQESRWALRGTVLDGRYQLGSVLGVGGTGVVFEAHRLGDGRPLVVKTLRTRFASHAEITRRLLREAEVGRAVRHPSLVRALDRGWLDDGSPYVVFERARGESLAALLRRTGPLPWDEAAAVALRAADALAAVHARGFVHRDVKPEHLLLATDGQGRLRLRLLDFGVCALREPSPEERALEQGRVYGTPSYVSPEQASGDPVVDGRADVYGLGVVLFEATSGRLPFYAKDVTRLLRRVIRGGTPPLAQMAPVSDAFAALVDRALQREREARFPTMRAMARALVATLADRSGAEQRLAARLAEGLSRPSSRGTLAAAQAA